MELIHTCYRITDPDRSVAFYEALGFEERRRLPIREEAVNIFMGLPGDGDRLELTYNFGVDSYELGTAYGHIAVTVDDIRDTLDRLSEQGIEPEKPPYTVRDGGPLLCFVCDPDGYRVELIERGEISGLSRLSYRSPSLAREGAEMCPEVPSESDADDRMLVGRCECGAVSYRVADTFLYAANCHCSRCRAATGSAFKAFAGIEREKLEIVEGMDTLLVFGEDELNDTRCGACGSLLFSVVPQRRLRARRDGLARGYPQHSTGEHIFVGSKAPWFEITDDLPQAEEL